MTRLTLQPRFLDLETEIARFDVALPIERALMPPASWYTEPAFDHLDRAALFTKTWQPVARVSDLAEDGDYRAGCFASMPWLVARGGGQTRAFHNACRHKGREVVRGAGRAEELVCGYHAWKYDLEGRLTSAPRIAGIEDFDRTEMSLPPMGCEVWGPWVMIHGDAHAPPWSVGVAQLAELLDARGWRTPQFHSAKSWDVRCNWKVYVDNYLDGGYHIPHMHPSLDAQLDMDSYRTHCFEDYSIQTSAPGSGEGGRIGAGAIYAWIFPSFMINVYGPCLDTNWVEPVGPDSCRVHYQFYFQPGTSTDFIEASIRQSDITQREDIEICESVQIGLGSPSYDRGRYAPRVEMGEHHFHILLAKRYAQSAMHCR
jgi:choline monooxygenase